jgi:uncharacterized protein YhaN
VKILALKIDGYGIWSGLRVERFSDGLNVLYGPNEAGKTTLLQFIRSVLYGFSDSRRQYLPPVHGGRPGGMAEVDGPHGHYEIVRHWLPDSGGEEITLTASDGTRQGEHLIKAMLSDIDETIFNNVFAVELREMQELGALGDTDAAELLYNLTAGLDRVSLIEVLRELELSRNRVLDAEGKPCLVSHLQGQREKIRVDIEELGGLTRRFGLLVGERSQLERELAKLEEERNQVERQSHTLELASSLRDRWAKRLTIDNELAELGPIAPFPDKMLKRLDDLNAKLDLHRQRIADLRRQRAELRSEVTGITLNEELLRQFARIEALQEQEAWFTGIEKQSGELDAEIARLESEFAGAWKQLGLNQEPNEIFKKLTKRSFAALRSPAKSLHRTREKLEQSRAEAKAAQDASDLLAYEITETLSARNETNLNEAMDKAGQMVAQYRRRLQIDERLDQLLRHHEDLDEQNKQAVERQLLPTWVLACFGAVFALSILLIVTGLLLIPLFSASSNSLTNWMTAALGVVGIVGTVVGKIRLEKSNAQRLDACQKQLAMAESQIKQLEEERDELDGQLPRGGGPLVSRLTAAEKDLAELEALVPLETRRSGAMQLASSATELAAQTEQEFKLARRKWRDLLSAAGLPVDMSSKQVRQLAGRWSSLSDNRRRLGQCHEELGRRQKEADTLAARLAQVASDANVTLPDGDFLEQLKHLSAALAAEQAASVRRDTARRELGKLRQNRARHEEALGRLNHRRRSLFFEAGAEDEDSFRQKATQSCRAETLRGERETLDRDITTTIGKQCTEEAIAELLNGVSAAELESRGNLLRDRLALLNFQVRERLEKRGQLTAQIQTLADDRQLPQLQLEMAAVEKQISDALRRWQVLAVLCRLLEDIRASYERERQPETLKEASGYLTRLTRGRYGRVWTPFGEKTLRVDDANGDSLPVESLSRGTREQLFLSLRLALSASYARRGAALPMVLDDVLVNFDADRAEAAAEVLRDFAAQGHQLLVCTCHEHIEKIFNDLEVPLNRLPKASPSGGAVIAFSRAVAVEEPKREKPRPAPKRKAAAKIKVVEEEPITELDEIPEAEPAPMPVSRMPKKSSPKPKKAVKSHGVFDVDFFDHEAKNGKQEEQEEIEETEEDESVWPEDDAVEEMEDLEDEEYDEFEGNGELT